MKWATISLVISLSPIRPQATKPVVSYCQEHPVNTIHLYFKQKFETIFDRVYFNNKNNRYNFAGRVLNSLKNWR